MLNNWLGDKILNISVQFCTDFLNAKIKMINNEFF